MKLTAFAVLRDTFSRFNEDRCWNSSIVISYFAFLCAVPLVSLFVYISTRVVGTSELALRSLNLFTDDFFVRYDPSFFKSIEEVSNNLSSLGWFGLIGSLISASFLFSNLIYTINTIFKLRYFVDDSISIVSLDGRASADILPYFDPATGLLDVDAYFRATRPDLVHVAQWCYVGDWRVNILRSSFPPNLVCDWQQRAAHMQIGDSFEWNGHPVMLVAPDIVRIFWKAN